MDSALYNIFSRLLWATAICYIIFACIHGYGGLFNSFLSLELWLPFSRLSYAIYIIQFCVMSPIYGSMKNVPYFSDTFVVS